MSQTAIDVFKNGCGDGYCIVRGKATGMHTNGGCRCMKNFMRSDVGDHRKASVISNLIHNRDRRIRELEKDIQEYAEDQPPI